MKRRTLISTLIVLCLVVSLLSGCGGTIEIDNSAIDFATSVYKHITNGGITEDEHMPYNVDAITGATLTVEGPGVVTSIPLSIRELENRDEGLFRGAYKDSEGRYIYEGMDLYYMLKEMTDGDNGIFLTDSAYKVQLKNSNRATVAELTLEDITAAHEAGRPVLIAYGVGTKDGKTAAPFVFDAKNSGDHSEGYVKKLHNDDGCLKLVYDLDKYDNPFKYKTFSNVAYIYICEETEPGFKHTAAGDEAYSSPDYTDYVITFRGQALGNEIDLTVAELEDLVKTDKNGEPVKGGMGYADSYSLANNAYWYVNTYEGLDLYKLLCYLGMDTVEEMGKGASRTTVVTFNAADGRQSAESFSAEALSYPDAFGFYNKNAADQNDGTYVPTNADLVATGYPVLLAYGVNNYPYTVTSADDGYLSGLSNNGGPMRVVFGKTQYNHANGSNQVQYLSEIIVGEDLLYNTHKYTDNKDLSKLAKDELNVIVNNADGDKLIDEKMAVGDIEDVIYGEGVAGNEKAAAKVKELYTVDGTGAIYEGIDLEYYLMKVVSIPGTVGTVTFSNGTDDVKISLDELFTEGFSGENGKGGIPAILAYAKNGTPLVADAKSTGYVDALELNPFADSDPDKYIVDNAGGPLMLVVPAKDSRSNDARVLENVNKITVNIEPDSYAHLKGDAAKLADNTVRFYGEGLEKEYTFKVSELESRQVQAKTLDYSMLNGKGNLSEQRYRGIPVYEIFTELGICNNAGDVTVYASDGSSVTVSLAKLKGQNYTNYASPDKKAVCAMLAYGTGDVNGDIIKGEPLAEADGGPLKLIVPMTAEDEANSANCVKNVVAIEVSANEITTWSHSMSDVYSEFLDYEVTVTVRNDKNECDYVLTAQQLESLTNLIVREDYAVLEIGTCEGIDLWKFAKLIAGGVEGIDNPVSVTAYADDGYKNDILSVVYMDGLENGVLDANGDRKPIIICYAVNGVPCVNSEEHEGYTGLAGNMGGPLRVVVENVQGASVKYFNKLVITVPGEGEINLNVDESIFNAK